MKILKYLKEYERDFIHFKTELLLEEASDDPVRKANLIRDIVRSIAVIPETITRTIYIKECSTRLEITEEVLYHEVNKLRQQKTFQDRNKYPGPEDLPVPPPVVQKPVKQDVVTYYSEKELIRLLLKFGSAELDRKIRSEDGQEEVTTVSDYIVKEIISDDLLFDYDTWQKIFEEFRFYTEQGIFPGDKYFVKHEDPEISRSSADLLSDPHILSRIWKDKHTYVETEDMKIKDIVPDVVLKFKSDKIKNSIKENMALLEEAAKAGDTERILELQKKDQNLKVALRMISEQLGKRIIL